MHGVFDGRRSGSEYFSRQTMYIDAMCAKQAFGVGTILVPPYVGPSCVNVLASLLSALHPHRVMFLKVKSCLNILNSKSSFLVHLFKTMTTSRFVVLSNVDSVSFNAILSDAVKICTRSAHNINTSSCGGVPVAYKQIFFWNTKK